MTHSVWEPASAPKFSFRPRLFRFSTCKQAASRALVSNRCQIQVFFGNNHRIPQVHLFTVRPGSATIDDDKFTHFIKCDQCVMPDPLRVIYPLASPRQERA